MKFTHFPALFLVVIFHSSCAQSQATEPKDTIKSATKDSIYSRVPNSMVRNVKQDRNGNILVASFRGVYQYDTGNSKYKFHMDHFQEMGFCILRLKFLSLRSGNCLALGAMTAMLEAKDGSIWFEGLELGSVVYRDEGKTITNLTSTDGPNKVYC